MNDLELSRNPSNFMESFLLNPKYVNTRMVSRNVLRFYLLKTREIANNDVTNFNTDKTRIFSFSENEIILERNSGTLTFF